MTDDTLLEVQNLHISYDNLQGKLFAVSGLTFSLKKGEGLALVGESGCGKSATAQSIIQLIPSPPGKIEKGKILFKNEDLLTKTEKQMQQIRGKDIGMVFQNPMTALNPVMKIGKQITEVMAKHLKLPRKQAKEKAIELLRLVGIPHPEKRFDDYPHQFSGGMRQRVMIAIALVCQPALLIADEPTTALDVTIQAQILSLIATLKQQFEMSLLLITHDLSTIAQVCERVAVMYAGRIVEQGSVNEIIHNPKHPYTKGLLQSLPSLDKTSLEPIQGAPPSLKSKPMSCSFSPRCPYAMHICTQKLPEPKCFEDNSEVSCFLYEAKASKQKAKFDHTVSFKL